MKRNVIFVPGGYWQADTIRKLKKNNSINSIVIDDDQNAPGKKYSDLNVDIKSHKLTKIKSFPSSCILMFFTVWQHFCYLFYIFFI